MVRKHIWDELNKARDSLQCAIRQNATDRIIMYSEVVRVLERILENSYVERRTNG